MQILPYIAPQYKKKNLNGLVKVFIYRVYIYSIYATKRGSQPLENCRKIKIEMVKLLTTLYVTEKF